MEGREQSQVAWRRERREAMDREGGREEERERERERRERAKGHHAVATAPHCNSISRPGTLARRMPRSLQPRAANREAGPAETSCAASPAGNARAAARSPAYAAVAQLLHHPRPRLVAAAVAWVRWCRRACVALDDAGPAWRACRGVEKTLSWTGRLVPRPGVQCRWRRRCARRGSGDVSVRAGSAWARTPPRWPAKEVMTRQPLPQQRSLRKWRWSGQRLWVSGRQR